MYNGIQTFGKIVEHRAEEKPNLRFVRFQNIDLTYGQFHSRREQDGSCARNIRPFKGANMRSDAPNSPEFLAFWLGLARLGVIEGRLMSHIVVIFWHISLIKPSVKRSLFLRNGLKS